MSTQIFRNVFLPSETNGTGFWRGCMPIYAFWSRDPNETGVSVSIMNKIVMDKNYYSDLNMFMVQRLLSNHHENFFNNYIVRLSEEYGFWTVFNIDDLTDDNKIPLYNRGRRAFASKRHQENIKAMMNNADFILTTTDFLKNEFHKSYDVPLDNIICMPNLLPRWWIGNFYDNAKKTDQFRQSKSKNNKPRIGIISSMSHYNLDRLKLLKETGQVIYPTEETKDVPQGFQNNSIKAETKMTYQVDNYETGEITVVSKEVYDNAEVIPDDFDTVIEVIEKTINDLQWVIVGYIPEQLRKYAEQRKIEVYPCVNILNYPAMLNELKLSAILSPLVPDSDFNKSKTHIKYLEACALGIILYAPNMVTYSRYMPEDQMYSSKDELYSKLMKFKDMSATVFSKKIEAQWKWLNSPIKETGWQLANWWLENNLNIWQQLFRMPKKCVNNSLQKYCEVMKMKKQTLERQAAAQEELNKNEQKIKELNSKKHIIFEDKENGIEIAFSN